MVAIPFSRGPPEYSLQGLMLKLKLQYSGHLKGTADSLEKTLMLGKIEGKRRQPQRMRQLDGIADTVDMNLGKLQEMVRAGRLGCCSPWGRRVRYDLATGQQQVRCLRCCFPGCDLLLRSLLSPVHPIKPGAAFWSLESRVRLLQD